ncbi:MAG: hypothetical protein U0V70_06505 [Terriglobia bacterium]
MMAPLGSRSSVLFDLDNDGDLDIVTNEFNSAPQVLISNLSQQKSIHWLKVELIDLFQSQRAGCRRSCPRRETSLSEIQRRQVRLSVPKCSSAVLWFG